MDEIRVDDINHLVTVLNGFGNNFVYRGHANSSWALESSLERTLADTWSEDLASKHETYSLNYFKSKFHLYDRENLSPTSKLAWLALMQHYGVPTRLLDFSESPYVALYFALESYDPKNKPDMAIFAIDYSAVMECSISQIKGTCNDFPDEEISAYEQSDEIFDSIVDQHGCDVAWIAEPKLLNTRIDRQAGTFLISGNRGKKIMEVLNRDIYAGVQMQKIVVARTLYGAIFAMLRKMNTTSASLYGDLALLKSD